MNDLIGIIVYFLIGVIIFAIHELKFEDVPEYPDGINMLICLFWPIELITLLLILIGNLVYKGLSKLTVRIK